MERWMWALMNAQGYLSCVHETRREVIADVLRGSDKTWRWWKRNYGLAAVKVSVKLHPMSPNDKVSGGE